MTDQATPAKVRLTDGLGPLVDSEEDPARLWTEIHTLRAAVKGPDGYATWQQAATAERVRRVKAERALRWVATVNATDYEYQRVARQALGMAQEPQPEMAAPQGVLARFRAWRERTGFLLDGRDGGM